MSEAATQAASEADKPAVGALVSVVIAITEAGADAREVVEGFGEALRAGGYQSEFVIVLDLLSEHRLRIETLLVDTRTAERNEIPFLAYELRRDP